MPVAREITSYVRLLVPTTRSMQVWFAYDGQDRTPVSTTKPSGTGVGRRSGKRKGNSVKQEDYDFFKSNGYVELG